MDYKGTLNLPQTDFPMKADLPKREPGFLKNWEDKKVYEKLTEKNKAQPKFILHDGPPYANGNIHFGHILNKVLKDIIVKQKNMSGHYSPYVPGWDCHGLPIELGALKELSEKEKDPEKLANPIIRRQACREYAYRFIDAQKAEFKRLGIMGDWDHPYLTLTNQYEADTAREFIKLYNKGYVYRGKKPVHWCYSCQTALAEAEVEYENHTSPSIYVRFRLAPGQLEKLTKPASLVIWTTTPWTLPANLALAVGENFDYAAIDTGEEIFIIARDLQNNFLKAIDHIGEVKEVASWKGEELVKKGLVAQHPFMSRTSKVLIGDHVTLETGTGVVHIAPGHGQEDYIVGQKNNLETLCPVDAGGKLMALAETEFDEIKALEGVFIKKAEKLIVDFLFKNKLLVNQPGQTLAHSYPHCWRCKNPVIFRATSQWFCSLAHNDLRKKTLKTIDCDVKWIPSWGHDRIYGMIENRPDWCLSRQRIWGVPITIFHCQSCQEPYLTAALGEKICQEFEKHGADFWWSDNCVELLKDEKCLCGGKEFTKDTSILDVWFDSGVSHAAVLERRGELQSPADLYLEGSDQHRGWFHSSLLTSLATRDRAPYKEVLTHGFVVDGQGKKYSKSAKNYVPPEKILEQMGAEILRLWVGAEDYRNDIRVSDEIIKVLAEIYRKIRNTCRFMLGNLYDFDPAKNMVPFEKRTELDRYSLSQLSRLIEKITHAYQNYEFHAVHHSLNRFFTVELSALYLDILKDRLYCDRADGHLRRSAQSTMYDILMVTTPLMAPILSFTAEEIWSFIPKINSESIFLHSWPQANPAWLDANLEARWDRIGHVRDEVLKALEAARKKKEIGHPLDAKVILSVEGELFQFLKQYETEWTQIFIVSQVELAASLPNAAYESQAVKGLKIAVSNAEGKKCERCWNYSLEVGQNATHPTLCGRCAKAVE